jgi:hypothetical protein
MIVKIRFFANRSIKQNKWQGASAPLSILQIGGIFVKNESNQSTFTFCLPEWHITLASPPLAPFTRLARHSSGTLHRAFYRRGRVSIGNRLSGDAESGLGEKTDNGN